MIDVGIIGGSGLCNLEGLKNKKEVAVKTPFGNPSDKIITGELAGVKIGFLARHNRKHIFTPTEVPYRANIYALKKLGARVVLAFSAVGSLTEKMPPKTLVFPDQVVDKTTLRPNTFFGNGLVGHAPFGEPFCKCLRELLAKEAKALKIPHTKNGTVIAMEGPAYSSKAESNFHRKMGWHLIGMTACPETKLAREAGLAFALTAMVTDYDCWKEDDDGVTHAKVLETMKTNEVYAKKLLAAVLPKIKKLKRCGTCNQTLIDTFSAEQRKAHKATWQKIKLILEK